MKFDVILAGVGGQGILSLAYVLDGASLKSGLRFKQAEVHGMAQRGGAVQSHLRISDAEIHSDLIPLGAADLILSVEPLEAMRYLEYLAAGGMILSSSSPHKNIPDYPDEEAVLARVLSMPGAMLLDSAMLARRAGNVKAQNTVMLGAASVFMPFLAQERLLETVGELFGAKGERVLEANNQAFRLGRRCAAFMRHAVEAGLDAREAFWLGRRLEPEKLEPRQALRFVAMLHGKVPPGGLAEEIKTLQDPETAEFTLS